jgi:hypothetical protein
MTAPEQSLNSSVFTRGDTVTATSGMVNDSRFWHVTLKCDLEEQKNHKP